MSLNLTAATTASLSGAVCPQATIRCVAENLPSLILLWFFNSVIVTQYTIPLVGMDEYPFRLDLYIPSQFANASGVIEVEAASQSEENPVHSNSVSTLRANLSMLREAGVTSISCGSANTRSKTYVLNFSISELSWGVYMEVLMLHPVLVMFTCSSQCVLRVRIHLQMQFQGLNLISVYTMELNLGLEPS